MHNLSITAIAAAMGLVFSTAIMAQSMSKDAYTAAEERIASEYKSNKAHCDTLSGNTKDICIAEAKGKEKIAKAELEVSYEPTVKNHYKASVAKAEADYAVAIQKCDEKSGNDKDVCVKEAKAVETRIKADAEAQMKTSEANNMAGEKASEARQEAATDKRDANYGVTREKCDSLMGEDKTRCVDEAKAKYSK